MSITFKSKATGDLLMVSAHAQALLAVLGKTGPTGILQAADMPQALAVLHALPKGGDPAAQAQPAAPHPDPDPDDEPHPALLDEPVSLSQRAWPLIRMIERAHAAGEAIVWGV